MRDTIGTTWHVAFLEKSQSFPLCTYACYNCCSPKVVT